MKTTLPFNLLFMLTIQLCHLVHAMDCPSTVYVELGEDGIINCQISNNGDVYWYRGNSTKTSPIARLENGQKKLSKESNRYDIDEEGSLIIKNIEEQNYGFYSVVNFYANDKHDSDLIKVEIAVKPQTMCPTIAGCNDCDHCVLTKSETGNISCSIGGTRPHVHLNIVTDSENWINIIRNISEETYDPVTDTWSSTVTVQYSEWYDCETTLHLRCVTEKRHLFELSDSVAHIKLDSCKPTTQTSAYQTPLTEDTKRIYVLAIPIAIVVIFVVIVLVLVLYRKSEICRKHKTDKVDMELGEEKKELLQNTNIPDNVQHVIDTLKKAYEDFQMFTSTPNGDKIPTDKVFQDVTFTITKAGNDNNIISSSQMVETLFEKERSFVFIDDGEYGRKAFKHYICSGLCPQNMDQNIIWYVNLEELDINMTISDVMEKQMNLHGKVSDGIIHTILSTHKCLFVFDEVHDELNQSNGDESTPKSEKEPPGELTINDVITGSHRFEGFGKARTLLISKNNVNVTSSFTKGHTYVRIAPFSEEYLNLYVSRIFKCYQTLNATNTKKSSEKTDGTVDEEDKVVPSVIAHADDKESTKCFTDLILDKGNIIRQIEMCPSSLILLIHLLISDVAKKVINNITFYIIRRSYLTRLILDCLQYQQFPSKVKDEDVDHLMLKLGRASFENSLEDNLFTETCKFISEYTRIDFEAKTSGEDFATALTMGILKLVTNRDCSEVVTDNVSYPSPDSPVEFRHKYIQEYAAAQVIASNKTAQERFLKSKGLKEDERIKRVLQFMHRKEAKKRQELLKKLVEEQSWNNLIDCLFECENDDDFIKIKSALSSFMGGKYAVNIIDTDKLYHGMAVSRFCKTLANHNVSPEAITFRKHCELQYFSQLKIPEVKFLVFFEIDFQQGDYFIDFVKKACQMKVKEIIQFVKCKLPDEIAKDKIEEIADIIKRASNAPKIHRTDSAVTQAYENNVQWLKLNLKKGCWEKA